MKDIRRSSSAFSLIELSIVLIIISFIAYGAYYSIVLIRQSRLNSIITEIRNIRVSTSNFIEKYDELPGDAINVVSSIEGLSAGDIGDGNWYIGTDTYKHKESHLFFKHLSYSGVYSGKFDTDGITLDGSGNIPSISDIVIGKTYPGTKLNSSYFFYAESSTLGNKFVKRNRLALFSKSGTGATAKDTYDLDIKIDDGLPLSGEVISIGASSDDFTYNNNKLLNPNDKTYVAKNNYNTIQEVINYLNPIKSLIAFDSTSCITIRDISQCSDISVTDITDDNTANDPDNLKKDMCVLYDLEAAGCIFNIAVEPQNLETSEVSTGVNLDCDGADINHNTCTDYCTLDYITDGVLEGDCAGGCETDPTLAYCNDYDNDGVPDYMDDDNDGDGEADTVDDCVATPTLPICSETTETYCDEVTGSGAASNGNATWPKRLAGTSSVRGSCYGDSVQDVAGPPTRSCQSNGNWGSITNPCVMPYCAAITSATSESGYATWVQTDANITNVSGTCRTGYSGTPTRDCSSIGEWQAISNPCTAVKCGAYDGSSSNMENLAADTYTVTESETGTSTANPGCLSGYVETETLLLTCSLDTPDTGVWTVTTGICEAGCDNAELDGSYTEIDYLFGTWTTTGYTLAGITATANDCDQYHNTHNPSGLPEVTCGLDGSWDLASATNACLENCDNGQLSGMYTEIDDLYATWNTTGETDSLVAAIATGCQPGYTENAGGPAEVTCGTDTDGNWDLTSVANACEPGCENSDLSGTHIEIDDLYATWTTTGTTDYGAIATATGCQTGYSENGSGPAEVACGEGGNWDVSSVGNECIPDCENSDLIGITEIDDLMAEWDTNGTTAFNIIATATGCQTGYDENTGGAATVTCGASGWDTTSVTNPCTIKVCDKNTPVYNSAGTVLMKSGGLSGFNYWNNTATTFYDVNACRKTGVTCTENNINNGTITGNYGETLECAYACSWIGVGAPSKTFICSVDGSDNPIWKNQVSACTYSTSEHSRATFTNPGQEAINDEMYLGGTCKSGFILTANPGYAHANCDPGGWDYTGYCYIEYCPANPSLSSNDTNGMYSPICSYPNQTLTLSSQLHGYESPEYRTDASSSCRGCDTTVSYSTWRRNESLICCNGIWFSRLRRYSRVVGSWKCDTIDKAPIDNHPSVMTQCPVIHW